MNGTTPPPPDAPSPDGHVVSIDPCPATIGSPPAFSVVAPDAGPSLPERPGPQSALRVISVVSGKGGVGKTLVSTSLALLAAERGQRVLLLDADIGLANADIVLGARPRHHLGDLLRGTPAEDVVCEVHCGGRVPGQPPLSLHLLAGGSGMADFTSLRDEEKRSLLDALSPLEDRFDTLIIDAGAGIGDNVCFFAAAAQQTVLVVGQEPTSLTDAYAAVKVLTRAGVSDFSVLVNNVPGENEARQVFAALSQVTGRFLDSRLAYLGVVPTDAVVPRAVMTQQPSVVAYPHALSTRCLRYACDTLMNAPAPKAALGGLKFFWSRFLERQGATEGLRSHSAA